MSNIRSTPIKSTSPGQVQQEYNRVSLALAIFAALCIFCALWGVNGFFTARAIVSIGDRFQLVWISWAIGWLTHIIVSLIEHHLWRLRAHLRNAPPAVILSLYSLVITVGVLDVLTSALSFLLLADNIGLQPTTMPVIIASTAFAIVIAIFPEAVIVWLVVALYRVIRVEGGRYA